MTKRSRYGTAAWQNARRAVLERDGYECQIRLPGCAGFATEADHVVSWRDGGAWYDLENLRAACKRCNSSRGGRYRWARADEAWRDGPTITLVWGPPLAGKSTYVAEHAAPGDLIVDYDLIGRALAPDTGRDVREGLHPAIAAARNAVLDQVRRNQTGAPAVWIVSTNPRAKQLFPFHREVRLDGGHANPAGDERTAGALGFADRWRAAGEPSRDWLGGS